MGNPVDQWYVAARNRAEVGVNKVMSADHATSQKSIGKPVIIEEFGVKTNRVNTYTTWYSTVVNSGLSGDLIWQAGISAQRGWDDGYAVFPNTPEYTLQKDHATALKARA
ncbi:hypothetical protein FRC09_013488 [Ceratobasidium sp. 395]|nr:hypothetical protein FRC09_013488 [Ceratobasidium sp. 395]